MICFNIIFLMKLKHILFSVDYSLFSVISYLIIHRFVMIHPIVQDSNIFHCHHDNTSCWCLRMETEWILTWNEMNEKSSIIFEYHSDFCSVRFGWIVFHWILNEIHWTMKKNNKIIDWMKWKDWSQNKTWITKENNNIIHFHSLSFIVYFSSNKKSTLNSFISIQISSNSMNNQHKWNSNERDDNQQWKWFNPFHLSDRNVKIKKKRLKLSSDDS